MCKNEVLKVQMLGGFSIMYGDRLITLKKKPGIQVDAAASTVAV